MLSNWFKRKPSKASVLEEGSRVEVIPRLSRKDIFEEAKASALKTLVSDDIKASLISVAYPEYDYDRAEAGRQEFIKLGKDAKLNNWFAHNPEVTDYKGRTIDTRFHPVVSMDLLAEKLADIWIEEATDEEHK